MYLSRKLAYNKKGNIQFFALDVYLKLNLVSTLIYVNECHFFISTTNKVRSNKMIVTYLRTFITKILALLYQTSFLSQD